VTVAGKFSTMSMPDLVQWARTAHRSGTLHLRDGQGKEIGVGLMDGRIIYSATNSPRETYGAYLLHFGLCSEADIHAALGIAKRTGAMFAAILVQEKKISRQQAIDTLTAKTIEDLCDAFLWPDGDFHFDPAHMNATEALAISLDPIRVVVEGVSRAEVWSRITAFIHPTSYFEPSDEPFDDGLPWEDARMARRVYSLLDGNQCVQNIVDRLPFGRYKAYRAISELLERKMVRPCDVTAVVDREKRLQRIVDGARSAAAAGRWTEAMEMLKGLASANPGRHEVTDALVEVTTGFRSAVLEHQFTLDDVPVVTIGPDALSHMNLNPTDAFLLSRIDGRLTVQQIVRISAMAEVDALRTFMRLLAARVIDFPQRT
jgi:hypothetical protein